MRKVILRAVIVKLKNMRNKFCAIAITSKILKKSFFNLKLID